MIDDGHIGRICCLINFRARNAVNVSEEGPLQKVIHCEDGANAEHGRVEGRDGWKGRQTSPSSPSKVFAGPGSDPECPFISSAKMSPFLNDVVCQSVVAYTR